MNNMEKMLEKMALLQEIIIEKMHIICEDESTDIKTLSFCTKIIKDLFCINVKYAEKSVLFRQEIAYLKNTDGSNNHPLVQNVYDIATLEDVLQEGRERFKDDLHLIEHHQNSMEVIKKARAYVERVLAQSED